MARRLTASEALEWVFERPRTAKLATTSATGFPHVAPVWVARDGDALVFNTGATTEKGQALLRDPRVALCFDDETPPFGFVLVRGKVEVRDDPDALLHWATTIAGRYMGDELAASYGQRNAVPGELLVIVHPTRITGSLGVSD